MRKNEEGEHTVATPARLRSVILPPAILCHPIFDPHPSKLPSHPSPHSRSRPASSTLALHHHRQHFCHFRPYAPPVLHPVNATSINRPSRPAIACGASHPLDRAAAALWSLGLPPSPPFARINQPSILSHPLAEPPTSSHTDRRAATPTLAAAALAQALNPTPEHYSKCGGRT